MDAWVEDQRGEDSRVFYVLQELNNIENILAKRNRQLDPGKLFPRLQDIPVDDVDEEVDPVLSAQQIKAAFRQFDR